MHTVSVLIKPASGACNMRCDYCFYVDEAAKRKVASYGFMSEKTLKNVIRKTLSQAEKRYFLAFQGGEPTLCGLDFFRNVIRYIGQYNKNHAEVQLSLQTNGCGITEEWARFFAEQGFLLGISVDGTEELHDRYRHGKDGGKTYERVQQSIRILDRYQVQYNILTVVHKETAAQIEEIYKRYRKNGWDFLQFITCLDPLGERQGGKPWSLLPEEWGSFLIRLFDLWYGDYRRGCQPFIRQFENYIGILLGITPESCEQRGVCSLQMVVEADGSVYPCDFYVLDEYRMGNFNEHRLEEILRSPVGSAFLQRSGNHPDTCRSCRWFGFCRGGCYRSRMEEQKGLNYFCKGYQMFFEARYEELWKIASEIRERNFR